MKSALFAAVTASFWNVVLGEPMVIVIGDSMQCGVGLYLFEEEYPPDPIGSSVISNGVTYNFGDLNGECWRDHDRVPGAYIARERGIPFVNLACGNARNFEVLAQWRYAKAHYDLEDAIIVLSFGANDAKELANLDSFYSLSTILKCFEGILPIQNVDTDALSDWAEVERGMDIVIQEIVRDAPSSSTLRMVSYPLQFRPLWGTFCWSITFPCARTYDAVISRINAVLQQVTEKYIPTVSNLKFVSIVEGNYLPMAACSFTKVHIRDIAITSFWPFQTSVSSFHPIEQGNIDIATRISESL